MLQGFFFSTVCLQRRLLLTTVGLICVLSSGCGSGGEEIRATGSVDDAQTVIVKALDAWKAGTTAQDLAKQEPKLIVGDEDWQAGRKLTAYEFPEPGVENGGHWRIPVKLTFDKDSPVTVFYAVTPGNPASVIRSDFSE